MTPSSCAFCDRLASNGFFVGNDLAAALWDSYPISPGHALIIPHRHEADFFALSKEEQAAIWALLPLVRIEVEKEHRPAAYNVGINVGKAAGQTVAHAHVHLIPRFKGDKEDPRGGVRWILPEKARYW
ncbi:MAG: HIT family protein [Pseudomonadota bacterium]